MHKNIIVNIRLIRPPPYKYLKHKNLAIRLLFLECPYMHYIMCIFALIGASLGNNYKINFKNFY